MTSLAARLEQVPSPVWIGLALLAVFLCWPLGLAILVCLVWSGTMGCCGMGFGYRRERTYRDTPFASSDAGTSGNRAFAEYRAAALRRLQEEQQEFHGFLARLRAAKDKAEFDEFMAERRPRAGQPG
jgi:Protein of unknown function (DUF2852)